MNRRLVLVQVAFCVFGSTFASQAASATRLPGFRSPSGNIKCLFVPGHLRCEMFISRQAWRAR